MHFKELYQVSAKSEYAFAFYGQKQIAPALRLKFVIISSLFILILLFILHTLHFQIWYVDSLVRVINAANFVPFG